VTTPIFSDNQTVSQSIGLKSGVSPGCPPQPFIQSRRVSPDGRPGTEHETGEDRKPPAKQRTMGSNLSLIDPRRLAGEQNNQPLRIPASQQAHANPPIKLNRRLQSQLPQDLKPARAQGDPDRHLLLRVEPRTRKRLAS